MNRRVIRLINGAAIVVDLALMLLAFLLAYLLRYQLQWFRQVDPAYYTTFIPYIPLAALQGGMILLSFALSGVYRFRRGASLVDEIYGVINGAFTGFVVTVFFIFFWRPLVYSRLFFLYATLLIILFLIAARVLRRGLLRMLRARGLGVDRVLIVGSGEVGLTVMRNLMAQPELGFQVIGFVDDDPERGSTNIGRFEALGNTANLPALLRSHQVDEVVITLPWQQRRQILAITNQVARAHVRPRVVPDLFQMSLSMVEMQNVAGIPMLTPNESQLSPWERFFKRGVDVLGSALGLLLFSPLLAIIAVAIRLDSPGPVIFSQPRVGRNGKLFAVYKFRTMVKDADQIKDQLRHLNEAQGPMFKIREDPRITRVGRFLRRTSLDELPQFWNTLLGDMSLVGPRPALPEEVADYADWHRQRLATAPGITGLWQVSGRSDLSFEEMVLLDIYYIENWSPLLDLSILLRTIPQLFAGSGAY
ncbi:MAG TPA: undecaprenyl-phosphate glucose phosphotransferase [Anaerolineae bacterium]|nr:undecaprenyl-phosphate glucose phosphotransferase [Anaerolineae bacterium]HNU05134.1 undecaprenyl-phosphate glucose phosphotransferase [Anaerolineae bacterium]